jgi:hypothetical protein
MPAIALLAMIFGLLRTIRRIRTKPRPRGLCADCAFVHMQYGATGGKAVFCTFGGVVRDVKLDVLYCTDYRNRNAPQRLVRIGFAPEVRSVEA